MLNESSYEFVNPGEDFYWYGRPMPKQDEDNVQACPSKEDIAYLVEWNMDMRAMVSYGYVGSSLGQQLTNTQQWTTSRTNRRMLQYLDDACKDWYSNAISACETRGCVSFTLGDQSWDSFFNNVKTPWIQAVNNYAGAEVNRGYDKLVPYESRLLSTQLSSVYTTSKGFPAKLTSYVQQTPATLWPVADGVCKQYYDLNRISCISKWSNQFRSTTGEFIANSIKRITQVDKPWNGKTDYQYCMVGNLANDTTCTLNSQEYLSGDLTATTETVYKYQSNDGFLPKGSPTYTVYGKGYWSDISKWQEIGSSYKQQISWTTNGDSYFVVSPRLKGRIDKLAVLLNINVSWSQSSSGSSGSPEYMIYKFLELEKSNDVDGYEVWKDASGFLRDCSRINTLVKQLLSTKQSNFFSFSWDISPSFGIVMKIKDLPSKQFKFYNWNWRP